MTKMMQEILKLSVPERITMVEAIWDSIAEKNEPIELQSEVKQFLDDRIEAHQNNSTEGSSWEEVKARIKRHIFSDCALK